MTRVVSFAFNPFPTNMYIVYDDTKDAAIFDPSCYTQEERNALAQFIEKEGLNPVRLINTHCHLDHMFSNKFVAEKYNLGLEIHEGEIPVLDSCVQVGLMYGMTVEPSPQPSSFLKEGDVVKFGNTKLNVLFTPGHSPASISFYCEEEKFVIAGDVLFKNSIGRTNLPGGNLNTLVNSIREKLYPLGDDVTVYNGHGPKTTIGHERKTNPYLINIH